MGAVLCFSPDLAACDKVAKVLNVWMHLQQQPVQNACSMVVRVGLALLSCVGRVGWKANLCKQTPKYPISLLLRHVCPRACPVRVEARVCVGFPKRFWKVISKVL